MKQIKLARMILEQTPEYTSNQLDVSYPDHDSIVIKSKSGDTTGAMYSPETAALFVQLGFAAWCGYDKDDGRVYLKIM